MYHFSIPFSFSSQFHFSGFSYQIIEKDIYKVLINICLSIHKSLLLSAADLLSAAHLYHAPYCVQHGVYGAYFVSVTRINTKNNSCNRRYFPVSFRSIGHLLRGRTLRKRPTAQTPVTLGESCADFMSRNLILFK